MFELRNYLIQTGCDLFIDWYAGLKDHKLRRGIDRRLARLALGNFGDCKPCQGGVWELRIDMGADYRIYYARHGQTVVLLLCGGNKRTQQADIARACAYWQDWQGREPTKGKQP